MITIIIASRAKGHELLEMLKNARSTASDVHSHEILIKLDDDDAESLALVDELKKQGCFVLVSARLGGYADLHKAYLDLFIRSDPNSNLIWILTDDVRFVCSGWDDLLKKKYNEMKTVLSSDLFTLHQANRHLLSASEEDALQYADGYPIFTRQWLNVAGFGPLAFTDAWCALLHFHLSQLIGADRRQMLGVKLADRSYSKADGPLGTRWHTLRAEQHSLLRSPVPRALALAGANNIAAAIERERANPAVEGQNVWEIKSQLENVLDVFGPDGLVRAAINRRFQNDSLLYDRWGWLCAFIETELAPNLLSHAYTKDGVIKIGEMLQQLARSIERPLGIESKAHPDPSANDSSPSSIAETSNFDRRQLEAVLASRSWKLTAPLRALGDFVRRLKRKNDGF